MNMNDDAPTSWKSGYRGNDAMRKNAEKMFSHEIKAAKANPPQSMSSPGHTNLRPFAKGGGVKMGWGGNLLNGLGRGLTTDDPVNTASNAAHAMGQQPGAMRRGGACRKASGGKAFNHGGSYESNMRGEKPTNAMKRGGHHSHRKAAGGDASHFAKGGHAVDGNMSRRSHTSHALTKEMSNMHIPTHASTPAIKREKFHTAAMAKKGGHMHKKGYDMGGDVPPPFRSDMNRVSGGARPFGGDAVRTDNPRPDFSTMPVTKQPPTAIMRKGGKCKADGGEVKKASGGEIKRNFGGPSRGPEGQWGELAGMSPQDSKRWTEQRQQQIAQQPVGVQSRPSVGLDLAKMYRGEPMRKGGASKKASGGEIKKADGGGWNYQDAVSRNCQRGTAMNKGGEINKHGHGKMVGESCKHSRKHAEGGKAYAAGGAAKVRHKQATAAGKPMSPKHTKLNRGPSLF